MTNKNTVTCVYCGHEYPDGTPTAKHAALTAHIAQCSAHPMRTLGEAVCKLMSIPFPPTAADLQEMKLGVTIMAQHATDEDLESAFFALDALSVFTQIDGSGDMT